MYRIKEDLLLLDRGESRTDENRYLAITGENLVDINGRTTEEGREIARKALDSEAVKNGATVISKEGCVDGDETAIALTEDDKIYAYNGGDLVSDNVPGFDFLVDKKLIEKSE